MAPTELKNGLFYFVVFFIFILKPIPDTKLRTEKCARKNGKIVIIRETEIKNYSMINKSAAKINACRKFIFIGNNIRGRTDNIYHAGADKKT
jgi:hypothetical protein